MRSEHSLSITVRDEQYLLEFWQHIAREIITKPAHAAQNQWCGNYFINSIRVLIVWLLFVNTLYKTVYNQFYVYTDTDHID